MIYSGGFNDKDEKPYQLSIEVDDGSSEEVTDLLFSDVPFKTDMDNSDDTIFKPVKYQSGTIGLLAFEDNYMFNIYNATAKHSKVILKDNAGIVKWIGYVTPSLYNIGYEARYENLDVDCIDGLSILQYFKYEPIESIPSAQSLLDIILHIIRVSDCYRYLYIQKSVKLSKTDNEELLSRLYLNQSLFFEDDAEVDEDGERITDDDDTYKDALEKILTYLGVTLYAEGQDLYIVDFDCIKNKIHDYYRVNIADGTITSKNLVKFYTDKDKPTPSPQLIGESDWYSIYNEGYQENDQTLSLTKVYNKVTVVDNFRSIGSIFPSIYDTKNLRMFYPIKYYPSLLSTGIALYCNNANIGKSGTNDGLYQFFDNKMLKFYSYLEDGTEKSMEQMMYDERIYDGVMRNNILTGSTGDACCICRVHQFDGEKYQGLPGVAGHWGNKPLGFFNWDNYVLFCLGKGKEFNTTTYSNPNDSYYIKMFETDLQLGQIVGNDNMYFVISGNFMYYDEPNQFGLANQYERKNDEWKFENFWISCCLEYQGQWWNGEQWQDTKTNFKLYCIADETDHYLGKNLEIKNTIPWTWKVNKTGTAIKLPSNIINSESPKFSINRPASPNANYRVDQVWMKDFDIELVVLNQDDDFAEDSDTKYTNIINLKHIEELGEISLDVCTYDDKVIADNCVTLKDGDNFSNLDTVYHPVLSSILDTETGRFEELLCCKIANQYRQPKVQLKVRLKDDIPINTLFYEWNLKRWFIVDSKSVDYRYKVFEYTLIEKE